MNAKATPPPLPTPNVSVSSDAKKEPDKYELARKRRAEAKARRQKLGGLPGQKLLAPQKPGFVRRYVNDDRNRIEHFKDLGYTLVEDRNPVIPSDDVGGRKSQLVGTKKSGEPLRAYLMEVPEDIYHEDQQAKEAKIRETENQVRNATVGGSQGIGSDESVYRPSSVDDNQLLED